MILDCQRTTTMRLSTERWLSKSQFVGRRLRAPVEIDAIFHHERLVIG
jgi:hypothetical protein